MCKLADHTWYCKSAIVLMYVACSAGILLYAADIALRMCQSSNVTTVIAWRVIGRGNNRAIVMTLPVDKVQCVPSHML